MGESCGAEQWWTVGGQGTPRSVQWGGSWPLVSLIELGAWPGAVGCARRHARWVLGRWGVPGELVADAEMLTSELLTNAVQATMSGPAGAPVGLRLLANRQRLVIEAWDSHPGEPVPGPVAGAGAESGRGLVIVHELASQWGTRRLSAHVKSVWAELPLPGGTALDCAIGAP